jgi:hypothetical protein
MMSRGGTVWGRRDDTSLTHTLNLNCQRVKKKLRIIMKPYEPKPTGNVISSSSDEAKFIKETSPKKYGYFTKRGRRMGAREQRRLLKRMGRL